MSENERDCLPPRDREFADLASRGHGRFQPGDRVVVRATPTQPTVNPRTPPYAVGRSGNIVTAYGVIDNPRDHHEAYPPMYSVRFEGAELIGPDARHVVIAEVHEEWLDPA